jgi:hypothetical protein
MARPRKYKHPPEGTIGVSKGPAVTKPEHDKAVFANRMLYEIGDDDLWKLREALQMEAENPIAELRAKVKARYSKGDKRVGLYKIDWKFICQLINWS